MLTPPVFLLLTGLQFAVGALVCACCQSWTLLLWPSAIGSVLCAFFMSGQSDSDLDYAKRSLSAIALIVFLGLAPAFGFAYTNWRFPRAGSNDLAQFAGKHVFLEGRVKNILPVKSGGQARFICAPLKVRLTKWRFGAGKTDSNCDGLTLLLIRGATPFIGKLEMNTHFRCACTVTSVEELAKRGKGGYALYLKRIGINSLSYFDARQNAFVFAERTDRSIAFSAAEALSEKVESLRGRLIAVHIQNLGQKVGSLLTAMVLGEKAVGLDSALLTDFRNVGLSHVLAASGFNLTVVTFSVHWACRALCVPALATNGMSFAMMIVFVLFAGNSSSVVRASLMCALAIFCSCLGRRVQVAGLLGATLLISVLADPLSVADPGFQLSYGAVSGIIFVVAPVASYLEEAVERRWLRWSLDCLFTVTVAQACVLPLQLFYFKQMGLLFLPANLLASLVVTPVTVAGFTSSLLVLLTALCPFGAVFAQLLLGLAALFDWLAAIPLNVLVTVVVSLSSCRWALITIPPLALWHVLLYYLVLILFFVVILNHLAKPSKSK